MVTPFEIEQLIDKTKEQVFKKTGIKLELEIKIMGKIAIYEKKKMF